jgi:hypothetical protein
LASRSFCLRAGVGITPSADLIVAKLDLQLVRMLRQAIRAADLAVCAPANASESSPRIEPRPRIHPTPLIEPRPHIHPRPHIEPRANLDPQHFTISQTIVSTSPPEPIKFPPFVQPPWRVLPWANLTPPAPTLKVVIKPPDLPRKGSVFDVFI